MTSFGPNIGLTAVARRLGVRNDPYTSFNFLVEIEGLVVGGFSEVSGLQVETQVEEYQEGGVNDFVHRFPGPTRYPSNLILRRGLTDLQTMWSWYQDVISGKIERRNGTVYLLDTRGIPSHWWDFREAFPARWQGPDLRADGNSVAVETIELAHHGLSKPQSSSAMSTLRGLFGAASDLIR